MRRNCNVDRGSPARSYRVVSAASRKNPCSKRGVANRAQQLCLMGSGHAIEILQQQRVTLPRIVAGRMQGVECPSQASRPWPFRNRAGSVLAASRPRRDSEWPARRAPRPSPAQPQMIAFAPLAAAAATWARTFCIGGLLPNSDSSEYWPAWARRKRRIVRCSSSADGSTESRQVPRATNRDRLTAPAHRSLGGVRPRLSASWRAAV